MNAFYKERHFILKWNPQTVVVFAIILYARLGLLITLHIEIGSFNITWIPSCSMENQLKASYSMWTFRGSGCIEILMFSPERSMPQTFMNLY